MERLLRCDCGFEVSADGDDELVAAVQRHAFDAHGMNLTRDEVLRLARRLEGGDTTQQPPAGHSRGETT